MTEGVIIGMPAILFPRSVAARRADVWLRLLVVGMRITSAPSIARFTASGGSLKLGGYHAGITLFF